MTASSDAARLSQARAAHLMAPDSKSGFHQLSSPLSLQHLEIRSALTETSWLVLLQCQEVTKRGQAQRPHPGPSEKGPAPLGELTPCFGRHREWRALRCAAGQQRHRCLSRARSCWQGHVCLCKNCSVGKKAFSAIPICIEAESDRA